MLFSLVSIYISLWGFGVLGFEVQSWGLKVFEVQPWGEGFEVQPWGLKFSLGV